MPSLAPNIAKPEPVRVFIGYDHRQVVAFTVLSRSIIGHAHCRVSIEPLMIDTLPIRKTGLTPFTFSRFLVPYLCDYQGWALFLDVDQLVLSDLGELWALRDDRYAIMAVRNKNDDLDYEIASMMLMNCAKLTKLTPEYVETTRDPLHRLGFADPSEIGELPAQWNHLSMYDPPRLDAKLVHFTQGVPVWPETQESEYAQHYQRIAQECMSAEPWANLMHQSRHAEFVYARLAARMKKAREQQMAKSSNAPQKEETA